MKSLRAARKVWRCRSGSTAVEFALICLPLVLLAVGTVEFGRVFFVQNGLAYAADMAAREVLLGKVPSDATDAEAEAILAPKVRAAFNPGDPDLLEVDLGMTTVNGANYRVVTVTYPFNVVTPRLFDGPVSLRTTRRVPAGGS